MKNIAEDVCETDSIFDKTTWARFSGAVSLFRDFVFAFGLGVWVSATIYWSVTGGSVSPNWLFFVLGIVLFLVFANCFLLQLKYYLLKVTERGVRSLDFFKGMIDTPWERVGFVQPGPGRFSLGCRGSDQELGELDLADYKYPEQLAMFMISQFELAGYKITIVEPEDKYDACGSEHEAVPRKVQRLYHLLNAFCIGLIIVLLAIAFVEYENTVLRMLSCSVAILILFIRGRIREHLRARWPGLKW